MLRNNMMRACTTRGLHDENPALYDEDAPGEEVDTLEYR